MNLHFEPVTGANRQEVMKLQTAPGQEGFIEDVSECLEEAGKRKCWRPFGIYDGDILVGFAMYGFFWEYLPFGRVWMDRLLIDAGYQGRGYGRAALEGLMERIRLEYKRKKVYLSVFKENKRAADMYEKYGFRFNGQHDTHGEDVMVYRYPSSK